MIDTRKYFDRYAGNLIEVVAELEKELK